MKKIILLLLVLFCNSVVLGQNENKGSDGKEPKAKKSKEEESKEKYIYQKIKIVEWDYLTGTYKENKLFKNLKINDLVQIKLINLPNQFKIASSVTFQNNHLENRNDFGGQISFDKNSEYSTGVKPKTTTVKEAKETLEKAKEEQDSNTIRELEDTPEEVKALKSKTLTNDLLNKKIKKEPKVNSETLVKDLEINDALTFIKSKEKNEKAMVDVNWQIHLIKIAQNNWKNQIAVRDSLINEFAKKIDTLNAKYSAAEKDINKLRKRREYVFPPVKIENYDYTSFNFNITDEATQNEINLNIPFRNYRGFKIDFSTGILANGLYSPTYKIIQKNDTFSTIEEDASSKSKFNTGICLLAHAYPRTGEFMNLGLASGFSYNLNQQNLNFLLGGSLLLGADQRFITSFGVNIGKVKQLPKYYEIETEYLTSSFSSDKTVPTVDVLKASWFLSVTYNLGIGSPSKTVKL